MPNIYLYLEPLNDLRNLISSRHDEKSLDFIPIVYLADPVFENDGRFPIVDEIVFGYSKVSRYRAAISELSSDTQYNDTRTIISPVSAVCEEHGVYSRRLNIRSCSENYEKNFNARVLLLKDVPNLISTADIKYIHISRGLDFDLVSQVLSKNSPFIVMREKETNFYDEILKKLDVELWGVSRSNQPQTTTPKAHMYRLDAVNIFEKYNSQKEKLRETESLYNTLKRKVENDFNKIKNLSRFSNLSNRFSYFRIPKINLRIPKINLQGVDQLIFALNEEELSFAIMTDSSLERDHSNNFTFCNGMYSNLEPLDSFDGNSSRDWNIENVLHTELTSISHLVQINEISPKSLVDIISKSNKVLWAPSSGAYSSVNSHIPTDVDLVIQTDWSKWSNWGWQLEETIKMSFSEKRSLISEDKYPIFGYYEDLGDYKLINLLCDDAVFFRYMIDHKLTISDYYFGHCGCCHGGGGGMCCYTFALDKRLNDAIVQNRSEARVIFTYNYLIYEESRNELLIKSLDEVNLLNKKGTKHESRPNLNSYIHYTLGTRSKRPDDRRHEWKVFRDDL